jgi:septal ring factor EnvC (AmiA/AmiB activator)
MSRKAIYLAAGIAAAVCVAALIGTAWQGRKIRILEHRAEELTKAADEKEAFAIEKEKQAAEYRAKAEYLEEKLSEIQAAARKQDEILDRLNDDVGAARSDVERTKRVRSITTTADELCRTLGELGHPCG